MTAKLLSSSDTINFLSRAAPRPWVKRMLSWMIFNEEIRPFFPKGRVEVVVRVYDYLQNLDADYRTLEVLERDKLIRANFEPEIASKLVGRGMVDHVVEHVIAWDEDEEPHHVSAGFFIFADELDWEAGTLTAHELIVSDGLEKDLFWDSEEHLATEFDRPEYNIKLSGLAFPFDVVEMLLPSVQVEHGEMRSLAERKGPIGRPRKWDWEGALAAVVALAQHPDGLPTGPGSQARVEEILSAWFIRETGEAPSVSQLRQRAQSIMRAIGKG